MTAIRKFIQIWENQTNPIICFPRQKSESIYRLTVFLHSLFQSFNITFWVIFYWLDVFRISISRHWAHCTLFELFSCKCSAFRSFIISCAIPRHLIIFTGFLTNWSANRAMIFQKPQNKYKKIITMGAIKALQKSTSWLNIDYYAFSTFSSSCSCTLEYSSVVRWILRDRKPNEIYLILLPRGLQYPLWSLVIWEYSEVGSGGKGSCIVLELSGKN